MPLTAPLYTYPAGLPVSAASLTLTLQRTTDAAPTRRTQSPAAWAANVAAALLTEAQLQGATPYAYRLPTLADAQRAAYALLAAQIEQWEGRGWWVAHQYLDASAPPDAGTADGWAWWGYAGTPPQVQQRVTGQIQIAAPEVAAGAPDAWPLPCTTSAEAAAGIPCTGRLHTLAQLRAVQAAGGGHLVELGQIRDEAVRAIQAAGSEAAVEDALALADTRWSLACAVPTGAAGPA